MRANEFKPKYLEEVAPLISIANWFSKKYYNVISSGAQQMGAGKIQKFTNQHLKTFMQFMGMNRVDWPTLTLYVVYRYMRLIMKLSEEDILDVVNSVMIDPTVKGKKFTNVSKIRDPNKNTLISSLPTVVNNPKKVGQILGEKLIAAGAIQQVQNHWDKQAGIQKPVKVSPPTKPSSKTTQTTTTAPAPAVSSPTVTTPPPPTTNVNAVNTGLAALGVTP